MALLWRFFPQNMAPIKRYGCFSPMATGASGYFEYGYRANMAIEHMAPRDSLAGDCSHGSQ